MKNSTKLIMEKFPLLESYLAGEGQESLTKLDPVEKCFLELAMFFENPKEVDFSLQKIYQNLQNDWLEFALEVVFVFFSKDTFLIEKQTVSFISEDDPYLNQTQFAEFLSENGLKYDRSKVNVYAKRGKIPNPDLILGNSSYWKKSVCEEYLASELREQVEKNV